MGLHRQTNWYVLKVSTHLVYLHWTEGQLFLTFRLMQLPEGPIDGIVYQDREQKSVMPAGNGRVRLSFQYEE